MHYHAGGQCVEGGLRLVNGPSQYEGRLEICLEGRWGTICDDRFSRNEAIVACRQLGFLTEGKLFTKRIVASIDHD